MSQGLRLNVGCGLTTPEGWVNIDGSWSARIAGVPGLRRLLGVARVLPNGSADAEWLSKVMYHDVRKPLPFPSDSVAAVYSSHMIEHLYLSDAVRFLGECHRVLCDGGVARMVVPDLEAIVLEYTGEFSFPDLPAGDKRAHRADRLNERLLLRTASPPAGNFLYRMYSLTHDFHSHKWMYDSESLRSHLEKAGFAQVQCRQFRESRIAGIHEVEQESRVTNGRGICVEGVKQ